MRVSAARDAKKPVTGKATYQDLAAHCPKADGEPDESAIECAYQRVLSLMKAIRYSLHFPVLVGAALLYWWAIHYDVGIFGFDYFHFGLTGALHSIAIVVALRNPRVRDSVALFRVQALWFIALATVLGAVTPILGLWGSIVWWPVVALLPRLRNLGFVFITGSAIGSAGYWALVRRFWMPSLGRPDLLRTVALCVSATLLVGVYGETVPSGFSITWPELGGYLFDLFLTIVWWVAFSISLFWSETTPRKRDIALATATVILVLAGTSLTQRHFNDYVKDDRARLSDLKGIAGALHDDWKQARDKSMDWQAPTALKDIPTVLKSIRIADPITAVPYDYSPLSGTEYQLCAVFDHDSSRQALLFTEKWSFPKGHHCFAVDASNSPYSFEY